MVLTAGGAEEEEEKESGGEEEEEEYREKITRVHVVAGGTDDGVQQLKPRKNEAS